MQSIKNIVRKVGAIAAGSAFIGATAMGAMAATLDDYPAPFVKNGAYNSLVVVHSANGLDQDAAMSIADSFKAAGDVSGDASATVTVSGDAFKLDKNSNHLNMKDYVSEVYANLDHSDLPSILKKEAYSDQEGTNKLTSEYTQKLYFKAGSLQLRYDQDKDASDNEVVDHVYLDRASANYLYRYEFDLDSADAVSGTSDLTGVNLRILGKEYTVVDATYSGGNVTKIVLLAGDAAKATVEKGGEALNGVSVVAVDSNGNQCQIEYAGSVYTVDKGSTKELSDGTVVGVTDTFVTGLTGGRDSCDIVVGANKVEIQNAKKVKVNDVDIDGTISYIGLGGLDVWNVTFTPSDREYIRSGEEYEDPVFHAFKFVYGGLTSDKPNNVDTVKIETDGTEFSLDVELSTGSLDNFVWCYRNDSNQLKFGEDEDNQMFVVNGEAVQNISVVAPNVASELTDVEGVRFLYSFGTASTGDSNIIEIVDIDTAANETDFKVLNTGTEYNAKKFTPETATAFTFMDQSFTLNISTLHSQINFSTITDNGGALFTKYGGNISFGDGISILNNGHTRNCNISFEEEDTGSSKETNTQLTNVKFTPAYDGTTYTSIVRATHAGSNFTGSVQKVDSGAQYEKTAMTHFGTKYLIYDEGKNNDYVTISYPEEVMYGEVYITPLESSVSGGASGAEGATLMKDTEVSDVSTYNAIVVGGPCANTVAASLLGVDIATQCPGAGYKSGEATIQLVDNGDNVAMIVAGYEQEETAVAAKVLEGYTGRTDLTGTSVTVTGTKSEPQVATTA